MNDFGKVKSLVMPALIGALCLSALALPAGDKGVTLRRKFKQGAVEKYKMSMQMNMVMPNSPQGMKMNTSANMTYTYKKVDASGATISMKTDGMKMKMVPDYTKSMPTKMPKSSTAQMKMDPRGNVSDFTFDKGTASSMGPMGSMFSGNQMGFGAILPEKPVRPGDSWTMPLPPQMAMFGMGKGAGIRQKFLGEISRGGIRVYDISSESHIPIDGMKMPGMDKTKGGAQASDMMSKMKGSINITGHMYLRKSDCSMQLVKMTMTSHIVMPNPRGGANMTMDQDMVMNLTRTK